VSSHQGYELSVKRLAYRTSADDLRRAFGKFGDVLNARIIEENGRSKGMGTVTFRDREAAVNAERQMNGYSLDGFSINVSMVERR
jgi:RNA recognition motif-containing protein